MAHPDEITTRHEALEMALLRARTEGAWAERIAGLKEAISIVQGVTPAPLGPRTEGARALAKDVIDLFNARISILEKGTE
jgi:hypothetical protein